MKIIYVADIRLPTEKAHGAQITKMCEAFAGLGLTVELVVPTRKNPDFLQADIFDHYHLVPNFSIRKIKTFDPTFLIKSPPGVYAKAQLTCFWLSLFFHFLFKKIDDDCVLYTRDELLLPLLRFFCRRVVWESHALPKNSQAYKKIFNLCYRVITLTQESKKYLKIAGVDENKILVAPDGVDLKIFDLKLDKITARKSLGLPPEKIILGYTGTFKTKNLDKGINLALSALSVLTDDYPSILFVAVGGSPKEIAEYRAVADRLGVNDYVQFFEKVDQKKLAIYYQAFDVLLMPFPDNQHYNYFMSPLKMFEYMAAQKPIIASDLKSLREILDDQSCLFFPPDNLPEFINKIKLVLIDKNLARNIAQTAYQAVFQYSWEKRAERIVDFLRQ